MTLYKLDMLPVNNPVFTSFTQVHILVVLGLYVIIACFSGYFHFELSLLLLFFFPFSGMLPVFIIGFVFHVCYTYTPICLFACCVCWLMFMVLCMVMYDFMHKMDECVQLCDLSPSPSIEHLYFLYQAAHLALVQVTLCVYPNKSTLMCFCVCASL